MLGLDARRAWPAHERSGAAWHCMPRSGLDVVVLPTRPGRLAPVRHRIRAHMDGNTGLEAARFRATIRKGLCDSPSSGRAMTSAQWVPEGYHSVTPYLAVDDAADAIAFYKKAFGATEVMRMPAPAARSAMPRSRSADRASCWPTSIRT